MAQRMTRKQLLKQDEITEAAFDFGHWLEENWPRVLKWAGAVALVVLAIIAGVALVNSRKAARESLLAEAQRKFQLASDSGFANDEQVSDALYAFENVVEKAGNSAPGHVALYFKAVTLRQLGRTNDAIEAAEQAAAVTSGSETLRASTELLLVDLYFLAGRAQDALDRLTAQVDSPTPAVPKEQALATMARIHKEQGDTARAREVWQQIVDEFPGTRAAADANRQLGS